MKEQILVEAQVREGEGSAEAGRLRRAGGIPAVVYRKGQPAEKILLSAHAFTLLLQRHHSEHMMMNLTIGEASPRRVLLKDVQHHPLTGKVIHADFHEVALDERFRVDVTVELLGEPVGVHNQGGVLDHLLREVEVECLPDDLMEQIEVDVSGLALGDSLTVGDIELDRDRYTILTDPALPIAAVSVPRAEAEPSEDAEAEGAGEPELVKGEAEDEEAEGRDA